MRLVQCNDSHRPSSILDGCRVLYSTQHSLDLEYEYIYFKHHANISKTIKNFQQQTFGFLHNRKSSELAKVRLRISILQCIATILKYSFSEAKILEVTIAVIALVWCQGKCTNIFQKVHFYSNVITHNYFKRGNDRINYLIRTVCGQRHLLPK